MPTPTASDLRTAIDADLQRTGCPHAPRPLTVGGAYQLLATVARVLEGFDDALTHLHERATALEVALPPRVPSDEEEPESDGPTGMAVDRVDNCDGCPFSFVPAWTEDEKPMRPQCVHPSVAHGDGGAAYGRKIKGDDLARFSSATPDWCPLRATPVRVEHVDSPSDASTPPAPPKPARYVAVDDDPRRVALLEAVADTATVYVGAPHGEAAEAAYGPFEHAVGNLCAFDARCSVGEMPPLTAPQRAALTGATEGAASGSHLIDGEFQSDKYPTCPRGKVPLSVKDGTAQDLLWTYAQRRRAVDAQFSADLETALRTAGYQPVAAGDLDERIAAKIDDLKSDLDSIAGSLGVEPTRPTILRTIERVRADIKRKDKEYAEQHERATAAEARVAELTAALDIANRQRLDLGAKLNQCAEDCDDNADRAAQWERRAKAAEDELARLTSPPDVTAQLATARAVADNLLALMAEAHGVLGGAKGETIVAAAKRAREKIATLAKEPELRARAEAELARLRAQGGRACIGCGAMAIDRIAERGVEAACCGAGRCVAHFRAGVDLMMTEIAPSAPVPEPTCTTCGKERGDNIFCSNGFHVAAPEPTGGDVWTAPLSTHRLIEIASDRKVPPTERWAAALRRWDRVDDYGTEEAIGLMMDAGNAMCSALAASAAPVALTAAVLAPAVAKAWRELDLRGAEPAMMTAAILRHLGPVAVPGATVTVDEIVEEFADGFGPDDDADAYAAEDAVRAVLTANIGRTIVAGGGK